MKRDLQADTDEATSANRAAVDFSATALLQSLTEAMGSVLGSTRDAARLTGVARSTLARLRDGADGARLDLVAHVGLASGLRLELIPARSGGRTEREQQPQLPDPVTNEARRMTSLSHTYLVALAGAELKAARRAVSLSAADAAVDAGLRSERTVRRWEAGSPPLLRHAAAIALSRGFDLGWRPLRASWRPRPWQLPAPPTSQGRQPARKQGRLAPTLSSKHQDWATPKAVIDDLLAQHRRFALDAAAAPETRVAQSWLGPAHPQWLRRDALADRHRTWAPLAIGPGVVYLNPPFAGSGTTEQWFLRVHFASAEDLRVVFPVPDEQHLRLGCLAAAEEIPVSLDAARLVVRHAAIVGSTGAGKTSAVASLLQSFVAGGWQAANIVVIDPHGEYARALEEDAAVRSVLGDTEQALRVPYWALAASEIAHIFTGAPGSATFARRFAELVAEERRVFAAAAEWLHLDPTAVTADTPIPFDLRTVWHKLDAENRETRTNKGDPATVCLVDAGDPAELRPAAFTPYNPAGQAPHQAPSFGSYGTMPDLLRLGLLDARLRFLSEPTADPNAGELLGPVMQEWLGGQRPVSVLDFSGVPAEAADVAIGVVLNLLFEVAIRSDPDGPGIGRPSPVLIVLEEAHRYLGEAASALTRDAANRIAREGRKYGIGLLLVTQRPTELPKTALAQAGTLIALRLSNAEDQGAIRAALPDAVTGLAAVLPSLRTGEAIVSGEALVLPARTLIDRPNPAPRAEDPSLGPWRQPPTIPDLSAALAAWRGTYDPES